MRRRRPTRRRRCSSTTPSWSCVSLGGVRRIAYRTFHTGYKKMDLGAGEIISRILLPRRTGGWRDFYRKVGTRRAQAISKVCMAASIAVDEAGLAQSRPLALGSVAPFVLRCAARRRRGQRFGGWTIA